MVVFISSCSPAEEDSKNVARHAEKQLFHAAASWWLSEESRSAAAGKEWRSSWVSFLHLGNKQAVKILQLGGGIQVAPTVGLCCVRHIAANSSDAHSGSRSDMRELKTKTPPSCKLTRKQDSDESIGRLPSQLLWPVKKATALPSSAAAAAAAAGRHALFNSFQTAFFMRQQQRTLLLCHSAAKSLLVRVATLCCL